MDSFRLDECRDQLLVVLTQEILAGASLLILANKQDISGSLTIEEITEKLNLYGEEFKGRHHNVIACSGITGFI